MRIQRHLKHGRCSAGRSRARTSGEAFPFRPARLVEMNVGVDDARENCQAARIDFQFRRARQISSERGNLSVTDSDVLLVTANEQIELAHDENDEARMTKDEGMAKPE